MPELPEVETIVRGLQSTVIGRVITDTWVERQPTVKTHSLTDFNNALKGLAIIGARRRAKYILIDLTQEKTLAIHQKMAGHLLYGKWEQRTDGTWDALIDGPAKEDPYNRFLRAVFYLDNGHMLALSDVRRFGRIYLTDTKKLDELHDFGKLGPEPLDPNFTLAGFQAILKKKKGTLKKVLMDPYVIAGIGNIYADEILWSVGIHPLSRTEHLSESHIAEIYTAMRSILNTAIEVCGHSERNYRNLEGRKGRYQEIACAYQLTGTACKKEDGGIIEKIRTNNRSAHFCPVHQYLI